MKDLIASEKKKVKKEIALRTLKGSRLPIEEIAEYTGLSVDEVKMLEKNEKLITLQ